MVNSRAKGARGERELAKLIREMFGVGARRGQQFCGANGDADVVGIEGVHIEAKFVENLNLGKAFEQSVRDAEKKKELPVVIHKKSRKPWMITLRFEDLPELANIISKLKED